MKSDNKAYYEKKIIDYFNERGKKSRFLISPRVNYLTRTEFVVEVGALSTI
jgi:hypothetical protein